jgi:large conductance mechanosensitive channel
MPASPPPSLLDDFKAFMRRGNVVDLAVAVALGAAFGDLVKAFVNGIVMPLVGYVLPTRMAWDEWTLGKVRIGLVVGATVHFVIVSSVVFLLCVKLLDTLLLEEEEVVHAARPTRRCPECLSLIPLAATRCRFCTIPLPRPPA